MPDSGRQRVVRRTAGYPSLSFLHSAGEVINETEKPVFLYYFGDHDPSGADISRTVERELRAFAPSADITFKRLAVTLDQIVEMNLPTRPTKTSDSRSKNFDGESVEVDAILPKTLKSMCGSHITQHIDHDAYEAMKTVEAAERQTLQMFAKNSGAA